MRGLIRPGIYLSLAGQLTEYQSIFDKTFFRRTNHGDQHTLINQVGIGAVWICSTRHRVALQRIACRKVSGKSGDRQSNWVRFVKWVF